MSIPLEMPITPKLVMSPHTALRAAALAAAIFTSTSASAGAAESAMPTRQASAYGMDWIPYIDPADLPPVSQRKAVCLVDTGVDVTPDLPRTARRARSSRA